MPNEKEIAFILSHKVARFATADKFGKPLVVPICYAYDGEYIYSPIDAKPKKESGRKLKRIRNIEENSNVSLVIDEYHDDWSKLCYVIIHGTAELIEGGEEYERAIKLLCEKYHQYVEMQLPKLNLPLIKITPTQVISWSAI